MIAKEAKDAKKILPLVDDDRYAICISVLVK